MAKDPLSKLVRSRIAKAFIYGFLMVLGLLTVSNSYGQRRRRQGQGPGAATAEPGRGGQDRSPRLAGDIAPHRPALVARQLSAVRIQGRVAVDRLPRLRLRGRRLLPPRHRPAQRGRRAGALQRARRIHAHGLDALLRLEVLHLAQQPLAEAGVVGEVVVEAGDLGAQVLPLGLDQRLRVLPLDAGDEQAEEPLEEVRDTAEHGGSPRGRRPARTRTICYLRDTPWRGCIDARLAIKPLSVNWFGSPFVGSGRSESARPDPGTPLRHNLAESGSATALTRMRETNAGPQGAVMRFTELAIPDPSALLFGTAPRPRPHPARPRDRRGPRLPRAELHAAADGGLARHDAGDDRDLSGIVRNALQRARQLRSRGIVLEFETLIEMTREPDLAVELTEAMSAICDDFLREHGLPSEIRLTPNDLREFERPPRQRSSALLDPMFEVFERGARAGGDLLSIESTGGKEVSDDALMACDIRLFVFSQAVLGARDMERLWSRIVEIARKSGRIAGGDTACGFGNTAMVLAEKGYIPKLFAAVARVATVARTLVAVEQGATGPDKRLRVRRSVPQGDHGHPHLDGGQDGGLRAPEPGGQRGRRLRGPLEPVRAERDAARRHGPDRVPRAARVRHAAPEHGAPRGTVERPPAPAPAGRVGHPPRPPGLRAGPGERGPHLARDRARREPRRRDAARLPGRSHADRGSPAGGSPRARPREEVGSAVRSESSRFRARKGRSSSRCCPCLDTARSCSRSTACSALRRRGSGGLRRRSTSGIRARPGDPVRSGWRRSSG